MAETNDFYVPDAILELVNEKQKLGIIGIIKLIKRFLDFCTED